MESDVHVFQATKKGPRDKEPGSNIYVEEIDDDDSDGDSTDNEEEVNSDSTETNLSATVIEEFIKVK
jgi:uncharacterized protein YbaA (DUF1428 family)